MRTTVVAAGAIFFAAVAAVPYVSGRIVEREIREAIDGYNKRQSFVTASIVELRAPVDALGIRHAPVPSATVPSWRARPRACGTRHSPACTLPPARATCTSPKPTPRPSTTTSAARCRLPSPSMSSSAAARAACCARRRSTSPSSRRRTRASSRRLVGRASSIAKDKTFQLRLDAAQGGIRRSRSSPSRSTASRCRPTASWATTTCRSARDSSLSVASYRGVQGARQHERARLLGVDADDAVDGHASCSARGARRRRRGRARCEPVRVGVVRACVQPDRRAEGAR